MKRRNFLAALLGAPVATIAAVGAVRAAVSMASQRQPPVILTGNGGSGGHSGAGGVPSGQTYGVSLGGAGGYSGSAGGYFGYGGDPY